MISHQLSATRYSVSRRWLAKWKRERKKENGIFEYCLKPCILLWNQLQIAGILAFNYHTYSSKYTGKHGVYRAGMPEIINAKELPTKITIEENLVDVTFNELEPDQ